MTRQVYRQFRRQKYLSKYDYYFRNEESIFEVKFSPRIAGTFEQEWTLEYHIKGLMGLAKTVKKIFVKATGKARVSKAIRANPSHVEFPKPQDGQQNQRLNINKH